MSDRKPARLLTSGLTGRVYAVTSYIEDAPGGIIVARNKYDVTDDARALQAAAWEEGLLTPTHADSCWCAGCGNTSPQAANPYKEDHD